MSDLLIIGANSDIAKATARLYAKDGVNLHLAARDTAPLKSFVADLETSYGVTATLHDLDILDYASHEVLYQRVSEHLIGAIIAVGHLGDQKEAETSQSEALQILDVNYRGVMHLLNLVANDLERKGSGFIVAISSVAGERGRQSNYFYGAAKAALTAYLSGLRQRLSSKGVKVITVKPGFVQTKMTAHLTLPKALTASPDAVAKAVYQGQKKGRSVVYALGVWRWIMLVIRMIPEGIFKKLDL